VVDISGVQQEEVMTLRPLVAPHLSPDGRFIAVYDSMSIIDGVTQGRLVVVDLLRGGQFVLSEPESLWAFQWTR
jgi:hypothetical protein